MNPETGRTLLEILKKRETLATDVRTHDGRVFRVYNIVWGLDRGDEYAHITTNCTPAIEGHGIDLFFVNEVAQLTDAETGALLFDAVPPDPSCGLSSVRS